jgi:hypothetical protein
MSAPFVPSLDTFAGGQMTDLPAYTGAMDLTALLEFVAPGNPNTAVNYSITLALLAAFINQAIASQPTVVTATTYNSVATDTRILVELASPAAATINLLASTSYTQPILVKDFNGTASASNPITITMAGADTYDGLASVQISNPYGWYWFNPKPTSGGFYAT